MATTLSSSSTVPALEQTPVGARFGEHDARQTMRNALIVTRREVRDSFRDWRIMGPIFVLTLVFPVLAQNATGLFIHFFEGAGAAPLIDNFLPLLPMIVGFFPISISLVIALETFVGEKERRSLEPLLSTPLTNTELYVGKTLAAMLPPLLASYLGITIYVGGLIFGTQQWRPEITLIVQIVALTTAQALVMVTGAVVVSSQTTSTRAANLLASFIVIPISLLVMLELFIMITNNGYVLWYIVIGLFIADIVLFSTGARIFNREELLGRQMDEINLSWVGRTVNKNFRGGAHNIADWYRLSVFPAVRQLRTPAIFVSVCMIGIFIGGFAIAQLRPDLQLPTSTSDHAKTASSFQSMFQLVGAQSHSVPAAVLQNVRVLVGATLLSVFSFGVLGVIISMVPFGVLGFLLGQPALAQFGIGAYVAAVLPHQLIQVPAVVLATAAALRLGAVVTHPSPDSTVGESWLKALADVAKVGVGVVLPLLIVAGIIEVYITPIFVRLAAGG